MTTWSEQCSVGVPEGLKCTGCPHWDRSKDWCVLFDEETKGLKHSYCKENKYLETGRKE